MSGATLKIRINLFLGLALLSNLVFWWGSHSLYAKWMGVPPVPSKAGAVMMSLGDPEFSFRSLALSLQHLGDGGGQTASLANDYDYDKLGKWLDLLNDFDPVSEHVPAVAAFYFGAVHDHPEKIAVIVHYLARIGESPFGEKWRWLAHAAVLARHRMNDLDLALDLAYKLSKIQLTDGRELPPWARQMPAFVLKAQGDKEASKTMMENMLLTSKDVAPQEVNFMASFLTEQLGIDKAEVDALLKKREALLKESEKQ